MIAKLSQKPHRSSFLILHANLYIAAMTDSRPPPSNGNDQENVAVLLMWDAMLQDAAETPLPPPSIFTEWFADFGEREQAMILTRLSLNAATFARWKNLPLELAMVHAQDIHDSRMTIHDLSIDGEDNDGDVDHHGSWIRSSLSNLKLEEEDRHSNLNLRINCVTQIEEAWWAAMQGETHHHEQNHLLGTTPNIFFAVVAQQLAFVNMEATVVYHGLMTRLVMAIRLVGEICDDPAAIPIGPMMEQVLLEQIKVDTDAHAKTVLDKEMRLLRLLVYVHEAAQLQL